MGRQALPIITVMKAVFILCTLLSQALGQTVECHPPMPAECGATDVRCDMGTYGDCWMGDYCMPEGYNCPPTCHIPIYTHCGEGEFACDMGMTAGCWMGETCMAEGSSCPSLCGEGEVACDMGSYGGCWSGDYCVSDASL